MSDTAAAVKQEVVDRSQPLDLAIDTIVENGNVRSTMDSAALTELANSIRIYGVLAPITIRSVVGKRGVVGKEKQPGHWQVVAGHRRLAAAKLAGLERIPVIIRDLTDQAVVELQVIENLQRENLHPLDEAQGYYDLVMVHGADVDKIATQIGKTRGYIFDRIQLVKLIDVAKDQFRLGKFQVEHAVKLARLAPADQKRALEVPKNDYDGKRAPLYRLTSTIFGTELVAKSPKELQDWIDHHVRLEKAVTPMMEHLFPETAAKLYDARDKQVKIVSIIEDHQISAEARDEKDRAFTPLSYRVVGKKPCDYQVLGVVVAGSNRGKSYMVCTRKDRCSVHWKEEVAARNKAMKDATKKGASRKEALQAARKKEQDVYAAQRAEQERLEQRWKKARPAVEEAFAKAVLADKITPTSPLGRSTLHLNNPELKARIVALIGSDTTPEGMLRFLMMAEILRSTHHYNAWNLGPMAKAFGVTVATIVAKANGETPPAPKAKKAVAKKKK